jgi:hypothetical protein
VPLPAAIIAIAMRGAWCVVEPAFAIHFNIPRRG